jgi:hypothetical protein
MKRIASAIKTLFWVFAALHLQAFWAWGICTLFDNGFLIGLFLFVSFIANFVGCYLIDLFFLNKSKYKTFDNPALLGITALLHVPAMIFGQKIADYRFYAYAQPIAITATTQNLSQKGYFFKLTDGQIDHQKTLELTYTHTAQKSKTNSNPQPRKITYKVAPLLDANQSPIAYICYNAHDASSFAFDLKYTLFRPTKNDYNVRYSRAVDSLQRRFGIPRNSEPTLYFELLDLPHCLEDYYYYLRLGYLIGVGVMFSLGFLSD